MKELLIVTNENEAFITPINIDGGALPLLDEFHVTYYRSRKSRSIRHTDIQLFWMKNTETGVISCWSERCPVMDNKPAGTEFDKDDEEAIKAYSDLVTMSVGSIDDKPVNKPAQMRTPHSNIININNEKWARNSQKLKNETINAEGYFLGAYATTYVCWSSIDALKRAILKNNSINSAEDVQHLNVDSFDESEAFNCYGQDQLEKAIQEGKVYAYLEKHSDLYLPNE